MDLTLTTEQKEMTGGFLNLVTQNIYNSYAISSKKIYNLNEINSDEHLLNQFLGHHKNTLPPYEICLKKEIPYSSPQSLMPSHFIITEDSVNYKKDKNVLFSRDQRIDLAQVARALLGRDDGIEALVSGLGDFVRGKRDPTFAPDFLRDYIKLGVVISDEELSRYGLCFDVPKGSVEGSYSQFGKVFSRRYFDAPFNFCLTYRTELIGSLGFDAQPRKIFITQIQGFHRDGEGNPEDLREKLRPIKWERALVEYAVQWAKNFGIPVVEIQAAKNNQYMKVRDNSRYQMMYDVTAKRCGFRRNGEGNYVKVLVESRVVSLQHIQNIS